MMRNKIALILIFIFSITCSSFGQKIKYKDYKNEISTKNYKERIKIHKYSPAVAGVCNYVLPSSGYFYVGEPIRGICVLAGELVTGSLCVYGFIKSMSVDSQTGKSPQGARAVMFSGIIATGLIQIWSIFDVVKIAKVKNLAYQETKLSLMVKPDLFIINQNDKNIATCGLKLSFNF